MTTEFKWILLCAAVAVGEGSGFALEGYSALWPVAAGLAALTVAFGYGATWRPWPYLAAGLLGLALALQAAERRRVALDEALELNAGRPLTATFVVGDDLRERPEGKGGGSFSFSGTADGIPVWVRLSVRPGDSRPHAGEVWMCTGWLGRTSDGLFGRRRPFWVCGRGSSARRLADADGGWRGACRRLRQDLSKRVGLGLEHASDAADLNRAMLLGERFRMEESSKTAFIAAGTVHVFAISGLHVLFITQLLELVLCFTRLPRRGVCLVLLPLVWLYVLVVGCPPSAVRAATMATFYHGAVLFWRRPNGFTAWSLAFLLTYVRDPAMVFDLGCTFSFVVMLALVFWQWWIRPFDARWPGRIGYAAVAWAAGVPLAAHAFGRITPGGLLANLVAVPLAGVSVSSSALGVVASTLSTRLAAHFNNFAALSTDLLAGLSRLVGGCPWSTRTVEPWTLGDCLVWYAAGVIVLLILRFLLLRNRTGV